MPGGERGLIYDVAPPGAKNLYSEKILEIYRRYHLEMSKLQGQL